jgi:hypothetical protein
MARYDIPATGNGYTYTATSTTLTGVGNVCGPHTVYLVFDASAGVVHLPAHPGMSRLPYRR